MKNSTSKSTSWSGVADWYDSHVETEPDSYHKAVILPNLTRLMGLHKGVPVLDLACGQGFFAREWARLGGAVTAVDISKELIERAEKYGGEISYHVASADSVPFVKGGSIHRISLVLAIQNIENVKDVFKECARVLTPDGKLFMVLNHPAFRVPKASGWDFDENMGIQYRRIEKYMSEARMLIAMHPGKDKTETTVSFHRPLQWYMKALRSAGLAITGMEEWISHKESTSGPRMDAENTARKEIPLFLMLEVMKRP